MQEQAAQEARAALLAALKLAIEAINATPNFRTSLPHATRPRACMTSYELLPQLERIVRQYEPVLITNSDANKPEGNAHGT